MSDESSKSSQVKQASQVNLLLCVSFTLHSQLHCTTPHHTAPHRTALHCTALHYTTLPKYTQIVQCTDCLLPFAI